MNPTTPKENGMKLPLLGKLSIVALVAIVSFLAAWQGSSPTWAAISGIAIGGGVAVAVFRGCSPHHRRDLDTPACDRSHHPS